MNLPASFGHVFRIGRCSNEGDSSKTSVTGPFFCNLGAISVIFESSGSFLIFSNIPVGISIFVMSTILWPISVKSDVSNPISSRFIEPNAFPKTGMS